MKVSLIDFVICGVFKCVSMYVCNRGTGVRLRRNMLLRFFNYFFKHQLAKRESVDLHKVILVVSSRTPTCRLSIDDLPSVC